MQTDRGLVRDHNEDFVARYEPQNTADEAENGWLYIVADGVGGADAGEVASEFACERTLSHFLEEGDEGNPGQRLVQAMQAANTDLRQLVAERNENKRMATTMVAAVIHEERAYVANVGDSRAYHWRDNAIRQITKDQSLVAKLVEEGAITEAEAVNHPHRNVILYSIGSERTPRIDLFELPLEPGDHLILCSDGLTRHLSDKDIGRIVAEHDLTAASDTMVRLANERGGQDNISVALIAYGTANTVETQKVAAVAAGDAPEEEARGQADETAVATAETPPQQKQAVLPVPNRTNRTAEINHAFLLPYTIFLAIVEALLIVMVWLLLRV